MICSKCNSQLPDGAKFCTVCGAPCGTATDVKPMAAPAPSEKKYFCSKCGLELQYGAKFCTACGAPANIKDVTPLANDGNTFGNGSMASVSLEKQPEPNDLVAAMPAPAAESVPVTVPVSAIPEQAPASIPVPAAAPAPAPIPAPVAASAPVSAIPEQAPNAVPTPAGAFPAPTPNYNGGFSAPNPGVPAYAPSGSADGSIPPYANVNGLKGAAAAVAVPGKKKVNGGKIALIIAIVLVVLAGAAAIFFFTNKATALSIVMGKPKYAAMVEKDSLKESVEKMDMESLSQQVKTVSSVLPMLANSDLGSQFPSTFMSDKTSGGAQFAKLMNASSMGDLDIYDIGSMIKSYGDLMQSTYGAKRISGSMTMNLELGSELGIDSEAEQVLKYINGSEITYDMAADGSLVGGELGFKFNGKLVNAKVIMEDDGAMYLAFPFASDKAIKVKIPTNELTRSSALTSGTAALELDPKELERLFGELIDVYSDCIKDSSVSMEKGSLTVAGSVIEGKQITADINGANFSSLIGAICGKLANDQYFCTQITNYIKNFDPGFTENDYRSALSGIDLGNVDGGLVIDTIIKNNGDVLAKSYKLVSNGSAVFEIAFADNDNEIDIEIKSQNQTIITVKSVKTSDTDGQITLGIGMGSGKSIGVVMSYSNVGTATFGKTEMSTGSYNISLDMSNADTSAFDSEALDMLKAFSMSYTTSVDNGTAKVNMTLDAGSAMKFNIGMDMTLSDDISAYSTPSNVIDLTDALTTGNIDQNTQNQLTEYMTELTNALNDVFAGTELEGIIGDLISGSGGTGNVTDDYSDKAFALYNTVKSEMGEVEDWLENNNVTEGDAYNAAVAYYNALWELSNGIDFNNCTQAKYESYMSSYNSIISQKSAIKAAVEAAGKNNNPGTTSDPANPGTTSDPANPGTTSDPTNPGTNPNPGTPAKYDNAMDLADAIFDEMFEVYDWFSDNNVYSGAAYDNAEAYQNNLRSLMNRVYDDMHCDQARLQGYVTEFNNLLANKSALKSAVEAAKKN